MACKYIVYFLLTGLLGLAAVANADDSVVGVKGCYWEDKVSQNAVKEIQEKEDVASMLCSTMLSSQPFSKPDLSRQYLCTTDDVVNKGHTLSEEESDVDRAIKKELGAHSGASAKEGMKSMLGSSASTSWGYIKGWGNGCTVKWKGVLLGHCVCR
jgi:hypothetical protein